MIRKVEIQDAYKIKYICETSLGHHTSLESLKDRIKDLREKSYYYIYVYEDEMTHEVYGFIQAQRYDLLYGDNGWNIIALAVEQNMQNKGIGKKLLKSLEDYAVSLNDSFIRLNSRVERIDAHQFYEHLGYVCDKTQKRFIKMF